jgi:uncharacterized membrane protein YeaQ/YmgE (transglycosylase-associated protein family)
MSNRMPSLAALLGLVAVAGYQNREKIGDFIKNMQAGAPGAAPAPAGAGQALGWYGPDQGAGFIGAIVGAVIVLAVWGMISKNRRA